MFVVKTCLLSTCNAIDMKEAGTCWRNRMAASSPCCLKQVVPSNGASEALRTARKNKPAQPTAELYKHTGPKLDQYTRGYMSPLTWEDTMYHQSCGQVNVIHGRHPTCLVCAVRTFSSDCGLLLWDPVDKFWPLRAQNMILRARATQNFAQTDDAGTRNVRIHIGMSMQSLPPPTEARNKKPLRSLARQKFANDYTTGRRCAQTRS